MATLTQDDIDFLKWMDHPDNIHFWVTDANGDKVLTRDGWNKAHEEYLRIKTKMNNGMPPLKFRRLSECQMFPGNE